MSGAATLAHQQQPAKAVAWVTCSHWACPTGRRLGVDLGTLAWNTSTFPRISWRKWREEGLGFPTSEEVEEAEEEKKCRDDL